MRVLTALAGGEKDFSVETTTTSFRLECRWVGNSRDVAATNSTVFQCGKENR